MQLTPSKNEIADILEKAADLYESETIEWCQGAGYLYGHDKLSACAQGAILIASGTNKIRYGVPWHRDGESSYDWWGVVPTTEVRGEWERLLQRANIVLSELHRGIIDQDSSQARIGGVPSWNDEKGRTKQDVIEAMKNRAKDLRNKQ